MVTGIDIYTVGHSTRPQDQLLEILHTAGIGAVVDVRSFPSSRRHPQFNQGALEQWLPEAGIDYLHFGELGGRRNPVPGSPNDGWRERGFRGYADHMASSEFEAGIERLEHLARTKPTAVMCAEALWWRCHRRLIADVLTVGGWDVCHLGSGAAVSHELTPFAEVGKGGTLTYPPPQTSLEV
jgi:uncharacterized protein (DUF488 family)